MAKARKYVVVNKFSGIPKRENYSIDEYELPPIQNGEIQVKVEWVSVDPYHIMMQTLPYDQFGFQVGVVEDSKDPSYPIGTRVVTHRGWCDRFVINTTVPNGSFALLDRVYKLPNLKGLPHSLGVGAVGMPGVTAYFGLLNLCEPKAGETVVVTGAAGAVGSLVGQIAKIKGCKVIGFCGSDDKVKWLEKELGFDKAFNYKTEDISESLKKAAPKGVDCYFDNVGGEISSIILSHMNEFGRVTICGSISSYDNITPADATVIQPYVNHKQIRIQEFLVWEWTSAQWSEAFEELLNWINGGQLKVKEHITEGFENIYEAFIGMMRGENMGKAVIKI